MTPPTDAPDADDARTITAAEYVALDRKPVVIYTYREGSVLAGETVRIGNAVMAPPEWVVGDSTIALITEAGYKVYVRPDAVLTLTADETDWQPQEGEDGR